MTPTASCLKHRQLVFLQGWGPDAGKWCHVIGAWPCDMLRAVQFDRWEGQRSGLTLI